MRAAQAAGWTGRRFLSGVAGLVGLHPGPVAARSTPVIRESTGLESHAPPLDRRGDEHVASTIRDPALAAQYTQNWQAHAQHSQPYVGRGLLSRQWSGRRSGCRVIRCGASGRRSV
jgi:hypothetical protein